MEKTIILYPGLGVGHFSPMMQLATALVAIIGDGSLAAAVRRAASSMLSVRVHSLLPVLDRPALALDGPAPLLLSYLRLVDRYNDRLHDLLCSTRRVHVVIFDSLSVGALGVTEELGIPAYAFYTSSASTLLASIQLRSILGDGDCRRKGFRELGDGPVEFFGLPPVPASHLLAELLKDPESDAYKATMAAMYWITKPTAPRRIEEGVPRPCPPLRGCAQLLAVLLDPTHCGGGVACGRPAAVDVGGEGGARQICMDPACGGAVQGRRRCVMVCGSAMRGGAGFEDAWRGGAPSGLGQ